jgi:hypothetical protein
MTGPRRVTVDTGDHGAVTITCPTWCTASHSHALFRQDITHFSAETDDTFGPVIVTSGWGRDAFGDAPAYLVIDITVTEYPTAPDEVEATAAALEEAAQFVRTFTRKLAELEVEGR